MAPMYSVGTILGLLHVSMCRSVAVELEAHIDDAQGKLLTWTLDEAKTQRLMECNRLLTQRMSIVELQMKIVDGPVCLCCTSRCLNV
jgi:hypothetical protein